MGGYESMYPARELLAEAVVVLLPIAGHDATETGRVSHAGSKINIALRVRSLWVGH